MEVYGSGVDLHGSGMDRGVSLEFHRNYLDLGWISMDLWWMDLSISTEFHGSGMDLHGSGVDLRSH